MQNALISLSMAWELTVSSNSSKEVSCFLIKSEADRDCGCVLSCSHEEQIFGFEMPEFYKILYMTGKYIMKISQ